MMRKKRCPYCHKWFLPNPRTLRYEPTSGKYRSTQKACNRLQCRRERKRQADRDWRERNRDWFKGRQKKVRLAVALGYRAALAGVRTHFTKAVDMVNHLTAAQADHSQHKAMKLYTNPTLLIIDELGRLSIDQKQGEHIFNVIDARYERGSTVITTNRAFRDWGKVFQDSVCAKGIIDRLIHHSEVIKITGESYRIKDRKTKSLVEEQ